MSGLSFPKFGFERTLLILDVVFTEGGSWGVRWMFRSKQRGKLRNKIEWFVWSVWVINEIDFYLVFNWNQPLSSSRVIVMKYTMHVIPYELNFSCTWCESALDISLAQSSMEASPYSVYSWTKFSNSHLTCVSSIVTITSLSSMIKNVYVIPCGLRSFVICDKELSGEDVA